ncbi:ABC transporter permease [Streptomyces kasugaensis]|uniref:ABC transporter permease n=2 Tax=Streptomyces kasugaensis TaxID=1946 RepID=A0A4Q9HQY7_STRKA|nr:ABC transporter permease subunit [Streptomyces kasugaensis]TBO56899.1 ABC transporter permease [Streptomyces kasugaensis]
MLLQAQPAPERSTPAEEPGTMLLQAQGQGPAQAPAQGQAPGQAPGMPQQQPQPAYAGAGSVPGGPQPQGQPAVPSQGHPQGHPQPQPGPNWQGGGAGYVSPIPVRRTHLGDALASEWTKIRSVRSTLWTLGVMVVLVLGISLLTATVVARSGGRLGNTSPLSFGTFGMMMGLMCLLTLGVLVITSEYGTGMIRTTLTACPSRARILTAKAIVFFALSFAVSLVTTVLVALLNTAVLGDMTTQAPTGAEWFKATVGVSLFVAMTGLFALALGALLRHSAGAITLMIGLYLLPLVLAIFMMAESLSDVRAWLLQYAIPSQLGAMYSSAVTDNGPSGWDPLWIMTGLTAVALGSAYAVLAKRDV